jgi:HSP20 family protein
VAITRYDPFTRLMTLRDAMDRMIDEAFGRTGGGRMVPSIMPIDMFERQDELIVMAAVPGAKPEDVDISVTNDTLTIRATIQSEMDKEEASSWNWYLHELQSGQFTRTISLPFPVTPDQADARFENGLLKLKLPKSQAAMPKRIKVQHGSSQSQQIGVGQQQGQQGQR